MSDSKILFLDIDNTLLAEDGTIPEENVSALSRAAKAGHRIVICSGRPLSCVLPIARRLSLTGEGCYLISYNGSLIYECGRKRTLLEQTMPMSAVRLLFEKADEHGLYAQTYEDNTLLIRRECEESGYYVKKSGISFRVVPELPDGLSREPIKVLLIDLHDKSRLERFRMEVAPLLEGEAALFFSSDVMLECVKAGFTKGSAVRWLCRHLGIPIENSVAAGDSENDIPMLEAARIGCAVANATPGCKDAADYITVRDCNHSGVAEIIEKFLL